MGIASPALTGRGSGVRVAGGGMNVGVKVGVMVGTGVNEGNGVNDAVAVKVGVKVGVKLCVAVGPVIENGLGSVEALLD